MLVRNLLICAVTSIATATAVAGPEWTEGSNDGGSTAATARKVSSAGAPLMPVTSTSGTTSAALIGGDQVDMLEIYISDPGTFRFTPSFTTQWNACLYLFRKSVSASGGVWASPLLAIDNQSSSQVVPSFNNSNGAMSIMMANFNEQFTPGAYYIAICGSGDECLSGKLKLFDAIPGSIGLQSRRYNLPLTSWFGDGQTGGWKFNPTGMAFIYANACGDAEHVTLDSVRQINTVNATSAGEPMPTGCGNYIIGKDVWYKIVSPCAGAITISTCGTVTFDSMIAVYSGDCGALVPIACNDDAVGCSAHSSSLTFTPDPCGATEFLVRIGSWGSSVGGTGTVSFTCVALASSADLNGDGLINGEDLGMLLGQWGTAP
ncbi:MAG: hypothetical protein EXS00_03420 [Phycisphaerales bacterium]|nr:hypothetical protein [Phycisphaerales bacterium]